ncbi:gamma-glutamyl-gamma-aminobutyrate hydrolase family protein [Brachyspira hyodysenteriae]|nr:gamma-glutamyl-gamma-aminobutyrate hydrolase family protein [Brachyspira hyodysenteriae]MDA1468358.1 gamma-glutamyl-gamma-aminobutyrate hydrolase family protein [Brachyspira hyodysenteriae]
MVLFVLVFAFIVVNGCQIINVAFGGSLYQDLSLIDNCYIKHSQSA